MKILFTLLLISGFTSGIRLKFGDGININYSQIFMIILLIYYILFMRKKGRKLKLKWFDYLIILYPLTNIFSSIIFSPDTLQSIKTCITIISFMLVYFITKLYVFYCEDNIKVIDDIYYFNIISIILGIISFIISLTGIKYENIGASYKNLIIIPSIKSLSYEPNLFAMISAVMFTLCIAAYFYHYQKYNKILVTMLVLVGIILSFTRTIYAAIPISILISLIILIHKKSTYFVKILIISVFAVITIKIIASYSEIVRDTLIERYVNLFNFEEGSGANRTTLYRLALTSLNDSLVFGKGTNTSQTDFYNKYTGVSEHYAARKGWLTGAWIQSLHDTGIIGFLIIISIFVYSIVMNIKPFNKANTKEFKTLFLWFFMGNIIIAIGSQMSSSLFISFPWIFWGINSAIIQKYYMQE